MTIRLRPAGARLRRAPLATAGPSNRGQGWGEGRGQNTGRIAPGAAFLYAGAMDYSKIITIEPGKRSGKPCIRGMRMTVTDVLEYLAGGMTHEELLADFPDLTEEDIRACLAFAADRERKLAALPA